MCNLLPNLLVSSSNNNNNNSCAKKTKDAYGLNLAYRLILCAGELNVL